MYYFLGVCGCIMCILYVVYVSHPPRANSPFSHLPAPLCMYPPPVSLHTPQAGAIPPLLSLAVAGDARRAPAAVAVLLALCANDTTRNTVIGVKGLSEALIKVLQSTNQVCDMCLCVTCVCVWVCLGV